MHFSPNTYFEAKDIIQLVIEEETEKNNGFLSSPIIARQYYEMVEGKGNEDDEIISEILFENIILDKSGTIRSGYIEGLKDMIKKVENGYKFTVLNDEEYEDLKSIIEKLKVYLAENRE